MAKVELDVAELVEETFKKHFGVTLDRLRELAEADRDGRIIITPAKKELTGKEASEITGYKCPICKHHEYCVLPMVTPLCGPVYDHFEEAEAALKAGDTP